MLDAIEVCKQPTSKTITQELLTQIQILKNQLKHLADPLKQLFDELEEFGIVFLYFELDSFPEELVHEFQEVFQRLLHLVTPALITSSVLAPQLQALIQRMNTVKGEEPAQEEPDWNCMKSSSFGESGLLPM